MKKPIEEATSQMAATRKWMKKEDSAGLVNSLWSSWTVIVEWFIEEDYNSKLSWQNWSQTFDEMRRTDAQVNATLLAMELPIRSTRWYVEAAESEDWTTDDFAWEVQDFVEDNLFHKLSLTWDDLLREILTMLPFGFSVFEKVFWSYDDKIILKKIAFRKQSTIFKRQTEDWFAWITQQLVSPATEWPNIDLQQVSIPADKLLIFSHRREGDNYEWISALRSAYKHWYIKDKLYKFDAVKHERQSIWIPVIRLPDQASPEDRAEALKIWMNIRSTEQTCVILPGKEREFEFANMNANSWSDLFESIKHHNREIAKNILAQFLELGDTWTWSRSLGESQMWLFLQSLNSIANQIADTFNRFIIPQLVDLNFDVEDYPKMRFDKIETKDLAIFANTISTLTGSWLINPDEDLEDHLREVLWLPARMANTAWNWNIWWKDWWNSKDDWQTPIEPKNWWTDAKNNDTKQEIMKASECEHWCNIWSFDEDYFNISKLINNKHIVKLQNETRDNEWIASLKAKWFKFNEFEKDSWRPLTFAERKVNFTSLKRSLETFETQLDESLDPVIATMKQDLLEKIKLAVEKNDIAAIWTIEASMTSELAQLLTDIQKEMFEIWKKSAAVEMNVAVPSTKAEVKGAMRVQNDAIVWSIINNIETATKTTATWIIAKHWWSVTSTSAAEVVGAVSQTLDKVFDKAKNTVKWLTLTWSINLWRSSIFERYPEKIYWFQFSAILDWRTTETCRSLDWRVVLPGSAEFYKYSPPLHYWCRSIRVEILQEETFKPNITWIPSSINAPASLDTFKDLKAPIILKNSPVVKVIQQEIDETKVKISELEASWKYQNRLDAYKARVSELEASLANAFHEMTKQILIADGVKFNIISE